MAKFQCVVVTPERTAIDEKVDFVALPLYDGELGVAAHHSPMIGRLGFGEMRLKQDGQVRRFYVDGGFVQIADEVVSILTNRALPAEQVDAEAAQRQLEEAQHRPASTPELQEIRDRLISQARAQIRVASHA